MSERPEPTPVFRARIIRVVDGDTQVYELDRFHGDSSIKTMRLLGVNTPERRTASMAEWLAAKEYVIGWMPWVISRSDHSWPLVVQTSITDKYGRELGRVWKMNEPEDLSTLLIRDGHGVARSALAQIREARG